MCKINYLNRDALMKGIYKTLLVMRLTIIIILITVIQLRAEDSNGQKLTYNKNNATISEVFKEIKRQTGYNVIWYEGKLNSHMPIDVNFYNTPLEKVMDNVLDGRAVTYEIIGNAIVVKAEGPSFRAKVISTLATIDVRGRVLDENNAPLVGAVVKVKGSSTSTPTNSNGEFLLKNIDENATLVISFLGYETREVKASKNVISIKLVLSTDKLEEVEINAGYYTVKDRERTGSISRVTADAIGKQPVNNPLQALQGRIPGVDIVQTTGVPGGAFTVRIRGRNSIQNGNEPLYILNGVQVATSSLSSNAITGSITSTPSPLSSINPADIESIEVLKDADATAIYGSRGANGVVLISTKKGNPGKTSVGFNFYQGIGNVGNFMDLLNTNQYIEMRKEAFSNDNATPTAANYDINGVWDQTRYTDWQKEFIGKNANVSNGQLSLSGGSKNTTFLVSGNYYRETMVFPGDKNYQKKSSLLNINHFSIDNRFKINASATYVIENNRLPVSDLTSFIFLAPNNPSLFTSDGGINWENGTFIGNPISILYKEYKADVGTLTLNSNVSYSILKNLELSIRIGFNKMQRDEIRTNPLSSQYQTGTLTANNRVAFYSNNWNGTLNLEPQLSWTQKVGVGKLNLLTGATIQESNRHTQTIQGTGFVNDGLLENIAAAATLTSNANETKTTSYRYLSLYGRINYNLYDTFYLNLTGRRDGSSRFGTENIYANFGAVGLGWIFSNHRFLADKMPFLSFGKLRASYGISGNDQIGDYQFLDLWNSGVAYQGSPTLIPTKLFNAKYAWETTKKAEIALELGFMKDKIHLIMAYFKNRSSNQLVNSPLPSNVGFTSLLQNMPAIVQNTGLEFELSANAINKKDLRWAVGINLSIPRNKLVAFPNIEQTGYNTMLVVGRSMNITKTLQSTGVNPTTGTYTFYDFDGTGSVTTPGDLQVIKTLGPRYTGGVQNTINYKMFELDFLFQFVNQLGKSAIPGTAPGGASNQPIYVLNRWQKANDITNVQKYTVTSATLPYLNNYSFGELGLANASFIRLKNISLAYNVPRTTLDHVGLQNLKIYLEAQNLFTITNYSGLDPESQNFRLPPLRMITAGIQATF